jgi:hypothetical protein
MPHAVPRFPRTRRATCAMLELLLRPFAPPASERWLDGAHLLHALPGDDRRAGIALHRLMGITPGH